MMWTTLFVFLFLASSVGYYSCNTTYVPVPAGFVWLHDIDTTIVQDIRYATNHNFVGVPACGYLAPKCYLTRDAAVALSTLQSIVRGMGLTLKVYDCFRPTRANAFWLEWVVNNSDVTMKGEFYPTLPKNAL
jgi:D-alanyl-D-alanine dipeptidase